MLFPTEKFTKLTEPECKKHLRETLITTANTCIPISLFVGICYFFAFSSKKKWSEPFSKYAIKAFGRSSFVLLGSLGFATAYSMGKCLMEVKSKRKVDEE
uniref:HIG1 domain-containing protein n=1 Tax=Acrobeloides nanus TaxID=290746 RepID=A0A914CZ96_9BILA